MLAKVLRRSFSLLAQQSRQSCLLTPKQFRPLQPVRLSSPFSRPSLIASSSLLWKCSQRSIFIQIEKTPNVSSLKFTPTGHQVLPEVMKGQSLDIANHMDALRKSELARELFALDGVSNVFLTCEYVTVSVSDTGQWPNIQSEVIAVMNDFLMSSKPVVTARVLDPSVDGGDPIVDEYEGDEIVALIRELIDARIRPNVQYDGGDVIFQKFDHDTGIVTLELTGACKGCSSSYQTLHDGIERMLTFYIPEVTAVEEINQQLQDTSDEVFREVEEKLADRQSPFSSDKESP